MKHPVVYTRMFHEKSGHPIRTLPTVPVEKERLLRCMLVLSEAIEFCEASGVNAETLRGASAQIDEFFGVHATRSTLPSMVEAADALADLNVVVNGSALIWGIPIEEIDWAVHMSNQSKLGADGSPIYDLFGKVVKGPNYEPPTNAINMILRRYGWKG